MAARAEGSFPVFLVLRIYVEVDIFSPVLCCPSEGSPLCSCACERYPAWVTAAAQFQLGPQHQCADFCYFVF